MPRERPSADTPTVTERRFTTSFKPLKPREVVLLLFKNSLSLSHTHTKYFFYTNLSEMFRLRYLKIVSPFFQQSPKDTVHSQSTLIVVSPPLFLFFLIQGQWQTGHSNSASESLWFCIRHHHILLEIKNNFSYISNEVDYLKSRVLKRRTN